MGLWSVLCPQPDSWDSGKGEGGEVSPHRDISLAVAASPHVPAAQ